MKGLKPTFISILAIGLLAGSAVGVVAQEEEAAAEEQTGSSYFTGELNTDNGDATTEPEENVVDGVLQGRGVVIEGEAIETSDPRITGSLARALNANIHPIGEFEDVLHETTAWRIENDEGAWSGQGSALIHGGANIDTTDFDTVVLAGEGAYDGLTAYILADWSEDPPAVEGAIFVGTAPPVPDALPGAESEAAE